MDASLKQPLDRSACCVHMHANKREALSLIRVLIYSLLVSMQVVAAGMHEHSDSQKPAVLCCVSLLLHGVQGLYTNAHVCL